MSTIAIYFISPPPLIIDVLHLNSLFSSPPTAVHKFDALDMAVPGLYISCLDLYTDVTSRTIGFKTATNIKCLNVVFLFLSFTGPIVANKVLLVSIKVIFDGKRLFCNYERVIACSVKLIVSPDTRFS